MLFRKKVSSKSKTQRILLLSRFPHLVQLVGIHRVVPNGVETAHNGGNRIEEHLSHPDDEHRVLLPEGLTSRNLLILTESSTEATPQVEL